MVMSPNFDEMWHKASCLTKPRSDQYYGFAEAAEKRIPGINKFLEDLRIASGNKFIYSFDYLPGTTELERDKILRIKDRILDFPSTPMAVLVNIPDKYDFGKYIHLEIAAGNTKIVGKNWHANDNVLGRLIDYAMEAGILPRHPKRPSQLQLPDHSPNKGDENSLS